MRLVLGSLLVLSVMACARAEPEATRDPAPLPGKRPPPPRPQPACATPVGDGSTVDDAHITGDTVTLCHGADAGRACWSVDLASGAYTPRKNVASGGPVPVVPPTASVNDDGTVKLCASPDPTSCTIFTPKRKADINGGASVSADLSTVAVGNASQTSIDIYDVATGKKRVTIKSWKTEMGNPAPLDAPTFAGDRLIMWAHASPVSSAARIYTLKGKRLASVGDKNFTLNPDGAYHLDGTQWAFKQLDGPTLIVVDVKTGKQVKRYDLRPLSQLPKSPDNYELFELGALGLRGNDIVYVTASGIPVVGLLDRKTGAIKAFPAPRCP
ncbi:MAG: hypothetical protein K8W52_30285 [Deltaproteobacteria bacterium]|nr:hypothetical protein [Deltaproteobacteria bacterium]